MRIACLMDILWESLHPTLKTEPAARQLTRTDLHVQVVTQFTNIVFLNYIVHIFHFYVAHIVLSHRIVHIGSEWFLTYLIKRKWILCTVDQSRQIARRPTTWMFWRITVFSRNSSSSMTLATSLRCRPWRRTGSRWLDIFFLMLL